MDFLNCKSKKLHYCCLSFYFLVLLTYTIKVLAGISDNDNNPCCAHKAEEGAFFNGVLIDASPDDFYSLDTPLSVGSLYNNPEEHSDDYVIRYFSCNALGCVILFFQDSCLPFTIDSQGSTITLNRHNQKISCKKYNLANDILDLVPEVKEVADFRLRQYKQRYPILQQQLKHSQKEIQNYQQQLLKQETDSKQTLIRQKEVFESHSKELLQKHTEELDQNKRQAQCKQDELMASQEANEQYRKDLEKKHKEQEFLKNKAIAIEKEKAQLERKYAAQQLEQTQTQTQTQEKLVTSIQHIETPLSSLNKQIEKLTMEEEREAELSTRKMPQRRKQTISQRSDSQCSDSGISLSSITTPNNSDSTTGGFNQDLRSPLDDTAFSAIQSPQEPDPIFSSINHTTTADKKTSPDTLCSRTTKLKTDSNDTSSLNSIHKKKKRSFQHQKNSKNTPPKAPVRNKTKKQFKITTRQKPPSGVEELSDVEELVALINSNTPPKDQSEKDKNYGHKVLTSLSGCLATAGNGTKKLAKFAGQTGIQTVRELGWLLSYLWNASCISQAGITALVAAIAPTIVVQYFLKPRNNPFIVVNSHTIALMSTAGIQVACHHLFGLRCSAKKAVGFLITYAMISLAFIYRYTTDTNVQQEVVNIFNDHITTQKIAPVIIIMTIMSLGAFRGNLAAIEPAPVHESPDTVRKQKGNHQEQALFTIKSEQAMFIAQMWVVVVIVLILVSLFAATG